MLPLLESDVSFGEQPVFLGIRYQGARNRNWAGAEVTGGEGVRGGREKGSGTV